MAKFYGGQSKYLVFNEKYYSLQAFVATSGLYFIFFALVEKFREYLTVPGVIALIIVLGPPGIIFYLLRRYFKHKEFSFSKGREGESIIFFELMKLPDDFYIFQDVKIDFDWNIDFVVLGPTGVFAVEVKADSGMITFDGINLLKDGEVFKKNIINQAKGEALKIKEILHEVEFVYPVLVFSNYRAYANFGFKPQNYVYVLNKRYLNNFIKSLPVTLDERKIFSSELTLADFVDHKKIEN
jgi:hypothetical protein